MPTQAEIARNNELILNAYDAGGSLQKQAAGDIDEYTRYKVREGGVHRSVMPFQTLQDSDLSELVETALPAKIVPMEPDSPAAMMTSFRHLPTAHWIMSRRYVVTGERVMSPWFQADVEELRTLTIDIRRIISDNSLKDIQTAEDQAFFRGLNRILVGPNQIQPFSGVRQWRKSDSSIGRSSLAEMKKILPSTPGRFQATRCVANNITMVDFLKLGRDEMGGDWSQNVLKDGWTDEKFLDMKWFITIKNDIVPTGSFFLFADDDCLGKAYEFTPTTMYVDRKAFLLSYFAYETIGSTIANPFALGRQDLRAS